jgi:hypothetical protein
MRALLAAIVLLCLAAPALAAMPGVPASGQMTFTVLRNGSPIGRHVYSFESKGSQEIVHVQIRILYVLLGIPFYRFEHDSTEVWQKGHLASLTSSTNDDGKQLELKLEAEGANLVGNLNGAPLKLENTFLPGSLWNPATGRASNLADVVEGKRLEVEAHSQGNQVTLTGKLNRQIWYDDQGALFEVRFKARDGSEIRYVRD